MTVDTDTRIRAAIDRIAQGGMVIVTDHEGREDEGDLIAAAALIRPEDVAFMVRHTTGILCVAMEDTRCEALALPPMTALNQDPNATAYTISCDAVDCGTGVSASDRARTFRVLAAERPDPSLLRRPGHIFPLRARRGGVLARPGHTEAAHDLAALAGLPAVGVLAELVNDDGTMMRGAALEAFAKAHDLLRISIDELAAFRAAQRADVAA